MPLNIKSLIPRHYERRSAAARRGDHLPSEEELLLGMPFLGEQIARDVQEFAVRFERTLARRGAGHPASIPLELFRELAINPVGAGIAELEVSLADHASSPEQQSRQGQLSVDEARRIRLRCRIYHASWGDFSASAALTADVLALGLNSLPDEGIFFRWILRALDLLAMSSTLDGYDALIRNRGRMTMPGSDHRLSTRLDFERRIRRAIDNEQEIASRGQSAARSTAEQKPDDRPQSGTVIVVSEVGNATTTEGKRIAAALAPLLGAPLANGIKCDLVEARRVMMNEFPHAVEVTQQIFRRLARDGRVEPTILVGPQGGGKSHYAKLLGASLRLPTDIVPFGGMADSSIMGTARRWSTGEPTFALAAIMRHKVANPLLVVDEVEKAAEGGQNGNALHALLALLEPETSSRYHDPWVQAPIDLSHVSWIMTANSIGPLSPPLRDRCHILPFPSPSREHLDHLVPQLLRRIAEQRGDMLDQDLALDGIETLALNQWNDGSLRTLSKMLSQILDYREQRQRERPN